MIGFPGTKRYSTQDDIHICKGQVFTLQELQLHPEAPLRIYYRRSHEPKYVAHWGQRKLLLNEIAFLTLFWNPQQTPQPVIVYVGAAEGDHIPMLLELFPQIKELHLYDPRPFRITSSPQIHIYNEYFNDETANRWAHRDDIFFISDIRTADYETMNEMENEHTILKDMRDQQRWVKIIQPVQAHLKFRLPYCDKVDSSLLQVDYLRGHILLQPWVGPTSTEARLVPYRDPQTNTFTEMTWDAQTYEEQLFYHNTVLRNHQLYDNPFLPHDPESPIDPPELSNDWDSLAEITILQAYLHKMHSGHPQREEILLLSQRITSFLNDYRLRHAKQAKSISVLREKSLQKQRRLALQEGIKVHF
jgi:hypothetical protein